MRWSFLFVLSLVVLSLGCGDSQTVSVSYSVTSGDNPDFIVVMSVDDAGKTATQNIDPIATESGNSVYFYDELELIKKCAVGLGRVDKFGSQTTGSTTDCNSLASRYQSKIFTGGQPLRVDADPLSTGSFKLQSTSDGYVVMLVFFNALEGSTGSKHCFQLFAWQIQSGKLVDGGDESTASSIEVTLDPVSGGATPTCFSIF